jgi:hypothetical protein
MPWNWVRKESLGGSAQCERVVDRATVIYRNDREAIVLPQIDTNSLKETLVVQIERFGFVEMAREEKRGVARGDNVEECVAARRADRWVAPYVDRIVAYKENGGSITYFVNGALNFVQEIAVWSGPAIESRMRGWESEWIQHDNRKIAQIVGRSPKVLYCLGWMRLKIDRMIEDEVHR